MSVLQMSQNSDLVKKNAGFKIKDSINGEIFSHNNNRNYSFTRLEQRQILDLLLAPMSPNRISRHLYCVFRKNISSWKIKQLLLSYRTKIKKLNERFDQIAQRKIIMIHIDETFKGQKISILVLIDAITGYILHLEWLERRTEEAISMQLSSLRELLKNVILVITDGAPYFPEVVKNLCPDAFHQICLIHVMRGLYTFLKTYKTTYQEKLRTYQSLIKKLKNSTIKKKDKRYTRKKLLQKLNYWIQKRRNSREAYGVTPYQKGILDKFPELRKINEKINLVRAELRSLEHTIEKLVEKEVSLKVQTEIALKQKNKTWSKYMVKCRLLHQFYRLFNLK